MLSTVFSGVAANTLVDSCTRPVKEGGGMVCMCLDIRSVNFFASRTLTLQLGMVEDLKVRQNSFIRFKKNSSVRFDCTAV